MTRALPLSITKKPTPIFPSSVTVWPASTRFSFIACAMRFSSLPLRSGEERDVLQELGGCVVGHGRDSKQSESGREGEGRSEPVRVDPPLSPEQVAARDRWQRRWNLPILLAALLPLFLSSPKSRFVEVFVGIGSWLVFAVDLFVQLRIDRSYLRRRAGKFDLVVVVLTFPFYLLPGAGGGSAVLLLARLGRVARALMATKGLRRFAPG